MRVVFLAVLFVLGACRHPNGSGAATESVFGVDDRGSLPTVGELRGIGMIITAGGGACTGFMMAPRIGLTAGHCTSGHSVGDEMSFGFVGDEENTKTIRILERGAAPYVGGAANDDWAIFLLVDAQAPAWLGYKESVNVGLPLYVAGYSTDLDHASVAGNCSVRQVAGPAVYHDCDMTGGASGGPLFTSSGEDQYLAVAIQSSHFENAQGQPFHQTWTLARSNIGHSIAHLVNRLSNYNDKYPSSY